MIALSEMSCHGFLQFTAFSAALMLPAFAQSYAVQTVAGATTIKDGIAASTARYSASAGG